MHTSKNRLIIFEGPDCVGKTTLSLAVAKTMKMPIAHLTCTTKLAVGMVDYQVNAIENAKTNMDLHGCGYVLDRHWPSELCYGAHFRGIQRPDVAASIEAAEKLNPLYVFCMDAKGVESAVARHRENSDPAHPYEDKDYRIVYSNYELLIRRMRDELKDLQVIYFDESSDWQNSLARKVDQLIKLL